MFGLHDQYRDYYYDCKKFDMELAVVDENRKHPYCDIWAGGKHTWLCASQALDFVKATYGELEENGVNIAGTYLDVFSIMWGDECFHPMHRLTRAESIARRRACFDYLREKGIIVSSEEAGHMPVMDGHMATRAIRESSHSQAKTIPIIAMTADAFAENVAEALGAGMNDHISKPIDLAILFDKLKTYMTQ
jgi:hypothetical protein